MRQHLSRYTWIVVPAALLVLAISWMQVYRSVAPGGARAYFYDLANGELFVALDQPGPIPSPSAADAEAVRAAVFACTGCADEADRFIAYLEKHSPEALAQLKLPIGQRTQPEAIENGSWLSQATTPPNWVPATSPQAQALRDAPSARCESQGVRCVP